MSARHEFWLTDDGGRRLAILNKLLWISYTRSVSLLSVLNFGLLFKEFPPGLDPWRGVDWRLEAWRAPAEDAPLRLEDTFMLRKPEVYTRNDSTTIIRFYGRNGIDLLNRRMVIQRAGSQWATKTDYADDLMKAVVREQMLYGSAVDEDGVQDNSRSFPRNEFRVQSDTSDGPTMQRSFNEKKVMDVLREIKDGTFQLNVNDPANNRIFFNVRPVDISQADTDYGALMGWEFETRSGLFGSDRTGEMEFSLLNENMEGPSYGESHLEEVNAVYVGGNGRGSTQIIQSVEDTVRIEASRWNRVENWISASGEADNSGLLNQGYAELEKGKPEKQLSLTFLNTPGGDGKPRSLYGVDWDLGDRLRVNYARRQFNAEVNMVYVSIDENGKEIVTGRNEVVSSG